MITLILTRHGHVEGIDPERFRGRADLPLTDLGHLQARALGRYITSRWHPVAIYSSPMARCVATGHEIALACESPLECINDLIDFDYGEWQWETYDDARLKWPIQYETWTAAPHLFRFPRGDSLQDLIARTANALRTIIQTHSRDNQTVILVGHDSVNRALLIQLLNQPLTAYSQIIQSPCSFNEIHIDGTYVKIQSINETQHLNGLRT